MAYYFQFIQLLMILMCLVFLRHMFWRTRFFLHTFQLNGYKLNEYWSWLKDHWNSHVLVSTYAFANVLLLIMLLFLGEKLTQTTTPIVITVFMIVWFTAVSSYRQKEKKPLVLTARVQRLLIPVVFLIALLPLTGTRIAVSIGSVLPDVYLLAFSWLMADILIPFIVMLAGWVNKPVENAIQNGFIRQARSRLESMPELTVIGITGSYGKTSTKFALASILSERFSVCFTPGSFNTPMGICKVINNDLEASHQILILEMGARYPGNIRELCEIAHPNIAVLTNIGKAHLETFGSQEVIARTKGELIQSLHPGELAVINADDPLVLEQAGRRNDIKTISAGLHSGDFTASDIQYGPEGCSFTVNHPDAGTVSVKTRLLGRHNVHNILLGFAVGHHLGLRLETMALVAGRMEPVEHRLEFKSAGSYTIIDDAFNSNPVGARNAVDVLAAFTGGRRILITPGMVELGEEEERENRMFGEHIGRSGIDLVILVGKNRAVPILDGLKTSGFPDTQTHVAANLFEANAWLQERIQKGDVVLYENDLPDTYNG